MLPTPFHHHPKILLSGHNRIPCVEGGSRGDFHYISYQSLMKHKSCILSDYMLLGTMKVKLRMCCLRLYLLSGPSTPDSHYGSHASQGWGFFQGPPCTPFPTCSPSHPHLGCSLLLTPLPALSRPHRACPGLRALCLLLGFCPRCCLDHAAPGRAWLAPAAPRVFAHTSPTA